MRFEIRETGARRAASRLLQLQHRIQQPRPALQQAADYWREREARRFATGGDGQWEPNREDTIRRKGHARIWVDSGRSMRSVTVKGAPGSVARITGATLRFGTSIYTARFVSRRRPLFNVTARDRRVVTSRIGRWLLEPFE